MKISRPSLSVGETGLLLPYIGLAWVPFRELTYKRTAYKVVAGEIKFLPDSLKRSRGGGGCDDEPTEPGPSDENTGDMDIDPDEIDLEGENVPF